MSVTILVGDCREKLRQLPDCSVQMCCTSPPYFGLRDYGHGGQIGLEPTPDAYVAEMVAVFREVRRVLRDDGTCWVNLGDSYASGEVGRHDSVQARDGGDWNGTRKGGERQQRKLSTGIPQKNLIGIPWMVAFALRADGWYLRQDIIWAKPNPMPESVNDRCTKAHEYLFLLTKRARYYFDAKAIAEQETTRPQNWANRQFGNKGVRNDPGQGAVNREDVGTGTRNRRSVWSIASQPFSGAHFATMPPDLVEPCILAGTSEKGQCPHCGAPWVRQTERIAGDTEAKDRPKRTAGMASSTSTLGLSGNGSKEWAERGSKRVDIGWAPSCSCHSSYCRSCDVVLDTHHDSKEASAKHDVSDLREGLSPVEEGGEVLQPPMLRGQADLFGAEIVRGVPEGICAEAEQGQVLRQVLLVGVDSKKQADDERMVDNVQGLQTDFAEGPSEIDDRGLCDGASSRDGAHDWPASVAGGGGSPQERRPSRQSTGEFGVDGKASARRSKTTSLRRHVPALSEDVPGARKCPHCGSVLERTTPTPIPQVVLDCFGGAGTTALVADRLQRNATIIELNPAYAAIARDRINGDGGLFAEVAAE